MEGEPDLPAPPAAEKFTRLNLSRPININPDSISLNRTFNTTSTCTSTTSSSSSSPPDFVRHVQAAFKRHRSLGTLQSNSIRPRRLVVPQRGTSKESNLNPHLTFDAKKSNEEILLNHGLMDSTSQSKKVISFATDAQEDAATSPPSECGSTINTQEGNFKPCNDQGDQPQLFSGSRSNNTIASSLVVEPEHVPLSEVQKKVHFVSENYAGTQETIWDASNRVDPLAAVNQDLQHRNFESLEMENSLRSEGGISSLMGRGTMTSQDQPHHQFTNFLQNDLGHAMTQSSVVRSACLTSTLMNSTSAPMISSTTYCSLPHQMIRSSLQMDPSGEAEVKQDVVQPAYPSSNYASGTHPSSSTAPAVSSIVEVPMEIGKSSALSNEQLSNFSKKCNTSRDSPQNEDSNSAKGNDIDIKSQPPSSKVQSVDAKLENFKSDKQERGASGKPASTSRKKGYDPDLFFKVNGKLYQRLGKIGSGGSSEVHKVISSDCKIYALKKIKLKGRDYATAYGFCQEIEYLNRLKGMINIIQLIDYEVTDKTLLQEVMNGSMSNKDARVKDDGYIYMVLEYGEIDLAHMLSQKWKELDSSNSMIDENWLRFYWQQILLAVNTIHEERIVHSDLKPANFLLVRGSLKLIDFGIAKAIMSDTTNIQRDSQVGTLSYMSPEAFMCNETDANGNTIKCGRPSDIWSLGCILYQMVYGRTPFSEYKTFWAKFKVITDPNHEITYEPMSNPWLLDLMKKCLAWDRNERWRIPQLLQHPFLVPPVPPQFPAPLDESCKLLRLVAESNVDDQKVSMLCTELENMLVNPRSLIPPQETISPDLQRKLLYKMSTLCFQLHEQLANVERDAKI
ncbi:probable serine/threonine-protein kinase mps1 isoform X2 [Olea europaea var. sylvestris]|uniref:probable serine/threonine-protein kinase mps1 isoform X2 n=1 Tax=Olea europaea var. sylvestris TaxID=158386 RepID=UPI000C1CDCE4|nr:probable serine/threonine-protein kinase mps1 isoform X2 [Olea europaea var. sylvestris]